MTSSSSSTCSTSSTSSTSCSSAPVWNDCKRPVSDIDIECTLCFNTLYQPITTPCGHTWCRPCLLRAVEVKPSCPCCRQSLPSYGCMQGRHPNRILTRILESFFSKTIEMRSLTSNQELPDRRLVVPIFVGSLALPGIPCFMRIFEERYRKMIQSCIGKDGIFGMCLPIRNRRCASDRNYSEFGTLLKIRNYQPVYPSDPQYQQENALPLYIVEAVGSHRFRVVEELSCEDGYCRAVIERVDDITEDEDDDDLDNNDAEPSSQSKQLCTISRAKAYVERRLRSMECNQRRHFERLHGPCPNDVGMLSFWLANVIPMDVYEKYSILPITSSQKRLEAVSTWLEKYLVVEECS
ncbi:PUA-like domain-containing protein [Polychytrium aggregatum]|uniref:PUA-like domain-containing protein n=1 Tax=Polychytrium aggregatum TaxID=110093 RepID=UPI0022FDD69F|nr:PUA-like domain-containing protein [Polychytrium aggregatum]KAI9208828.1 PUA-like domain-containing protein [Polychytrium aggregatum]